MTPEMNPMDPALERAVSEIRDEAVDAAVVEAAAGRVWARLMEAAPDAQPAEHIRSCADFQALIPDYRAGRLPESRAMLLKDHLHQCVACRRVSEGKLVAFPAPRPELFTARRANYTFRWAAAAVVVLAAGASIWIAAGQFTGRSGRAYVQTVSGALYEISASGVRPLGAGQDLPDGVAIRTAKDSYATVQLRDGSIVEMRERSEFSTSQNGKDITVQLGRGDLIFQAAKRRSGHLYVATADCRVAVTGTVFSVNAGVKGSRISVLQGEVHVSQDNQDKILRPGDQSVTGTNLERVPIQYDISWSRDTERIGAKLAPPAPHVSPLLQRIPGSPIMVAVIPNAGASLTGALDSFRPQMMQNPQLRELLASRGVALPAILAKLQGAGDYLDEIAIAGFAGEKNQPEGLVFLASVKRPGLPDFLSKQGLAVPIVERPGLAVFGPDRAFVESFARSLDAGQGPFQASPCYQRLTEAQRDGATVVMCADLARLGPQAQDARYLMGEQSRVNGQEESRVTLGFNGPRTGIASWLAPPAPMGSLDYLSPETTFLAAFVVKSPGAIIDQMVALQQRSAADAEKALAEAQQQTGIDVRNDLASALGGEFALAVDGPIIPTPSVKLIAEVYDPVRFEATLEKTVEMLNREIVRKGSRPLRTARETVDGRTYYMIGAADPNPLTEVHYTFSDGYLIAGLGSRVPVEKALQQKTARTSISRSVAFQGLMPRDHYANFSAVIYQNFGTTLAPIAGLLGAFMPKGAQTHGNPLDAMSNMKPTFIAAYGEPDRITIAGSGNMLGTALSNMTSGSLLGIAGGMLPMAQFQGTRGRAPAYANK